MSAPVYLLAAVQRERRRIKHVLEHVEPSTPAAVVCLVRAALQDLTEAAELLERRVPVAPTSTIDN